MTDNKLFDEKKHLPKNALKHLCPSARLMGLRRCPECDNLSKQKPKLCQGKSLGRLTCEGLFTKRCTNKVLCSSCMKHNKTHSVEGVYVIGRII